jgi:hypothetical protein
MTMPIDYRAIERLAQDVVALILFNFSYIADIGILKKLRTVCACHVIAAMISAIVAPLARFILARTSAFLSGSPDESARPTGQLTGGQSGAESRAIRSIRGASL